MNPIALALMLSALLTNITALVMNGEKEHAMSQYMLILHENPSGFANVSVDEMHKIVMEYVAWKEKIQADGRYVGSNKLADEGGRRLVSSDGQVRVTDGPYSESKEVVGGYFIVTAKDYDEAVAIARGCPHLKYGGTIDIRLVEEMRDAATTGK